MRDNPNLSPKRIDRIRSLAQIRSVQAGEVLYETSQPDVPLFIVLESNVSISRTGEDDKILAVPKTNQFPGEMSVLSGKRSHMLRGLPRPIVRRIGGPIFRSSSIHSLQGLMSRLPFAWLAMNLAYVGWHIPKAYEFALSSENWHNFEHFCFLATSLIFWWPIVQPWPARRRLNAWLLIPYLLTADFVNTGLSAFLCFSGRLLYPSYGIVERPFGIDALKDQIAAGAFMWVCGSLVFLVPSIYLITQLLSNGRLLSEKTGLERARALAQ